MNRRPAKNLKTLSPLGARVRRWLVQRWVDNSWVRRAESEKRFLALFEHAGEAMVVCNAAGEVLAANGAVASLFAEAPAALVGKPLTPRLQQAAGAPAGPFVLRNGEATLHQHRAPERPVELRITRLPGAGGEHWLVALRDNADRVQTQERLAFLANFDSLTGLPNRTLFRDRLAQAMGRAQRSGRPLALMFLDLDRFKVINDSLGHEAGDRLLQHVAQTLTHSLRGADSVARLVDAEPITLSRLGGDEFTVIAEGLGGVEDAMLVARRLLDALNTPVLLGGEEVVVSASIGISMYPTDDVDLDTLVRHTDMAMYRSKSLGRSTYSFFSDDLNAAVAARLSLEVALRHAMERNEFLLHFQPKVCLRTGTVTGVEALLRWQRPDLGLVPPDRFISVLEDTGMILPVGAWVIRAACAQLGEWDRMGLPPLRMAVNLSARQFRHQFLASMVEDTLRENCIVPGRLEIELTESLLMEDNETNRSMLASFSRMGVRMAIDDFGTGHSSLSYLKRFNIDTLKIDRSFVKSLPDSSEDLAISTAIIAMARSMQMSVVAEGVETEPQAQILRELGCDEMQGYLLSRPLPPADLVAWLHKRLRLDGARKLAMGRDIGELLALTAFDATA
ncbi:MAG: EAL domain-containing protein [Rubrivivax sp.]|nr:EAL domain-containing protein [Rubrivivax sp.]